MTIGDAYFPDHAPSEDLKHVYFVCTLPDKAGKVVVFNMTSIKAMSDKTCVLQVGDHSSVTRPSCIYYRGGDMLKLADIEVALKFGLFSPRDHASDALIHRIRQGAFKSDHTEPWLLDAIEHCDWTPQ